jgi:hypothetical protein
LGFSLTYEKTQSKSFPKLILDLQLWPKLSLTAEKVLVGLSRSQRMDDLRILPFSAGQTEEHLFKLKPNVAMLNWLSGFNSDGKWCPELTKESIKKFPLQKSNGEAHCFLNLEDNSKLDFLGLNYPLKKRIEKS